MPKRSVTLYATVNDGALSLDTIQSELRTRWLSTRPDGSVVVENLSLEKKPKSSSQLGAIFGLIIATVKSTLDDRGWDLYGAAWTEHQIRAVLYAQYHAKFGGTKTLSIMDMAETSDFIDSCFVFCAGPPWRIYVPNPDPSWREKKGQ